jgi:hypothetical protein
LVGKLNNLFKLIEFSSNTIINRENSLISKLLMFIKNFIKIEILLIIIKYKKKFNKEFLLLGVSLEINEIIYMKMIKVPPIKIRNKI